LTRSVDDLVKAMGGSGVSKAKFCACARRSTRRPKPFLAGRSEATGPIWIDATYLKVRQNDCIVSVAVIIAAGVNGDGRREGLGMDIGPSEAAPFPYRFLAQAAAAWPARRQARHL
jgi:transposase-like protein